MSLVLLNLELTNSLRNNLFEVLNLITPLMLYIYMFLAGKQTNQPSNPSLWYLGLGSRLFEPRLAIVISSIACTQIMYLKKIGNL